MNEQYQLILADPPWKYGNWSAPSGQTHNRQRGAAKHYPTLTVDQICQLAPPAADDAILLIWAVNTHLQEALYVIRTWGFTYKTLAWTWLKTDQSGRPRMGMGSYTRQCTELCLLAVRGKPPKPVDHGVMAFIAYPAGVHSAKPDCQYDMIDRLWPFLLARLEMFARKRWPGWDVYSDELESSIEL